ncbi:MAG: Arm DNA-binding domain-containing protein [Steroidobacteraceae bacterium]
MPHTEPFNEYRKEWDCLAFLRFRYRFAGKCKTLSLGSYPVVTLDWARSRHQSFRDLLAHGIDPSALKTALGEHRCGVTMREWEAEQGRMHAGIYLCPLCSAQSHVAS